MENAFTSSVQGKYTMHNTAFEDDSTFDGSSTHTPETMAVKKVIESGDPENATDSVPDSETKMTYDTIIDEIGNFGWWQALILTALSLPDMFYAFALLLPVFTGATPDLICTEVTDKYREKYETFDNFSRNYSLADNVASEDVCDDCNSYTFDDSFTTVVSEWNLVCDKDYVSDLITTIQMSGLLVGAGIFGQLSDSFGRKKAYFAVCCLLIVGGIISGFAPNWETFAAMRFIVGLSSGGYFCVACVYPLEFIGAQWRTLCGTIGLWAIGEMVLALIAFYIREWRTLTIVTSLLCVVCFPVLWFIPESPRWLAQKDKTEEAKAVFSSIARHNKRPVPDMSYLDKSVEARNIMEDAKPKKYTYLDLFSTRSLAVRTFLVLLTWLTLFLTYYELSYNLRNLSGDRYFNMFLAGLVDLGAMMMVILLNNKMGRKHLQASILVIAILANIFMLTVQILKKEEELHMSYKIVALVGKGASLAGTYVIQIFTAELYPTCIRNVAVGAGSVAARVGALCAPQVLYLGTKVAIAPYLIILSLCVLVLPLTYLHPETSGQPLADNMQETRPSGDMLEISDLEGKPNIQVLN